MEFKIGDVVCLKSGSPAMTISEIGKYGGHDMAKCVWFDAKKKYEDLFEPETLEIAVSSMEVF